MHWTMIGTEGRTRTDKLLPAGDFESNNSREKSITYASKLLITIEHSERQEKPIMGQFGVWCPKFVPWDSDSGPDNKNPGTRPGLWWAGRGRLFGVGLLFVEMGLKPLSDIYQLSSSVGTLSNKL